MTSKRAILGAAAFVDAAPALSVRGAAAADIREIVQRFLSACYDDLGKAPRLLDGDDLVTLLQELLPRHFGKRDPLAAATEEVLGAYLRFLGETEVVLHAYEQRRALDEHAAAFRDVVASGAAHRDGVAVVGDNKPDVNRADKVGRNDPCPCGSGKKFKKCCGLL